MFLSSDDFFDRLPNDPNVFDFSRFSASLPRAGGGRDNISLLSDESSGLLGTSVSPEERENADLRVLAIEPLPPSAAGDIEPKLSSALMQYNKPARHGKALAVMSPKRPRIEPKRNPYGKNPWGRKGTLRCERCRQMRKKVTAF